MKRSVERVEALQFLVESVADRSGARALLLMDEAGRIMAGTGMPGDVMTLARTARESAWGSRSVTDGSALTARAMATADGMLYFAGMGNCVAGVREAEGALQRILVDTVPA